MTKEGHKLLFGLYANEDDWNWEIYQGDYSVDFALEIVRMLSLSISQIVESIQMSGDESSVNGIERQNGGIAS